MAAFWVVSGGEFFGQPPVVFDHSRPVFVLVGSKSKVRHGRWILGRFGKVFVGSFVGMVCVSYSLG